MTDARVAYTFTTRPGWGHPEDVVPVVAQLAAQDSANPRIRSWALAAVRHVNRDDVAGEARALLDATLRDLRYSRDPIRCDQAGNVVAGVEFVQAPRYTLADGGGDCDDLATLLGAAFQSLGRRVRFMVGAYDVEGEHPKHILLEVAGPDGWISVDPVPKPRGRVGVDARVPGVHRAWNARGEAIAMNGSAARVVVPRRSTAIVLRRRAGIGGLGLDTSAVEQAARDVAADPTNPQAIDRAINEARNVVEASGGDWNAIAKRAVTEGIRAALSTVGLGFLADLIGPVWNWLSSKLSVTVYPHDEFIKWAQEKTGVTGEKLAYEGTGPKGGPWDLVVQAMMTKGSGFFPIYLGDKDANAIAAELDAFGWPARAVWSKTFGDWYTEHKTRSGLLLLAEDMRAGSDSIKLAASRWIPAPNREAAVARAAELAPVRARATELLRKMEHPVNAAPLFVIGSSLWPGAGGGVFPPMPGATAPAWLIAKANAPTEPVTAPPTNQPPPAGSVQLTPRRLTPMPTTPIQIAPPRAPTAPAATLPPAVGQPQAATTLPTGAPAGAVQLPGQLAQLVGSILAAQQSQGASAASVAARAFVQAGGRLGDANPERGGRPGGGYFRGGKAAGYAAPSGFVPRRAYVVGVVGVDGVARRHRLDGVPRRHRLDGVGAAPLMSLQTTAAQLETLARQAVYAVTNPETVSVDTTRRRLLAFQQGAGLPMTGDFDVLTRAEAKRIIGQAWVGEIPLRTFREAPTPSQIPPAPTPPAPTEPVQVAPPGTVPTTPTSTGLPAGVPAPSATAPTAAPPGVAPAAAAAATGGGVMVAPPGSVVQAGAPDDTGKILLGIVTVAAVVKHKRRARAST
jgi:hypothetical protein